MRWDDGAVLAAPPRSVPRSVRLRLYLDGPLMTAGLLVLIVGVFLSSIFFTPIDLWKHVVLTTESAQTQGLTSGWSVTSRMPDNREFVANHFTYDAFGQHYEGISYATNHGIAAGTRVVVKVVIAHPEVAVITPKGRPSEHPLLPFIFIWLLPAIGMLLMAAHLKRARRRLYLLRYGIETDGIFVSAQSTNLSVNDETVYRVVLQYRDQGAQLHKLKTQTTDVEALTDEATETILFNPKRPQDAEPIDNYPDWVHLTEQNTFAASPGRAVSAALGRLLPLLGFAYYLSTV